MGKSTQEDTSKIAVMQFCQYLCIYEGSFGIQITIWNVSEAEYKLAIPVWFGNPMAAQHPYQWQHRTDVLNLFGLKTTLYY